MELELEGDSDIEMSGNIEITLPNYMTMLSQEELNTAHLSQGSDVIIAAGRKPLTSEIVMFTADKRVFVLDAASYDIPKGRVFPIDFGRMIAIDDEDNRGFYEMHSHWAIELSEAINVSLLS